jgi:chromosome segregation ATPase
MALKALQERVRGLEQENAGYRARERDVHGQLRILSAQLGQVEAERQRAQEDAHKFRAEVDRLTLSDKNELEKAREDVRRVREGYAKV